MFHGTTIAPVIDDKVFEFIRYTVQAKLSKINDDAVADLQKAKKALVDYTGPSDDIISKALENLIQTCQKSIQENIEVRDKAIAWLEYYKSPPTVRGIVSNGSGVITPRNE